VNGAFSRLHRAERSYEALLSDLLTYEQRHAPSGPTRSDPVYQMAIQSVREDLHCDEKLIPYTIGAMARLSEFPKAKSPGLPWKLRGYKSKGDVVAEPDNVLEVYKVLGFVLEKNSVPTELDEFRKNSDEFQIQFGEFSEREA
jgi:hypothetical protein